MPPAKRSQSRTRSESQTSAREQLAQREQPSGDPSGGLSQRAKEQDAQQRAELRDKGTAAERRHGKRLDGMDPAGQRAKAVAPSAVQGGLMDSMSQRSGADAMTGHFVHIDLNNEDVQEAYAGVFPEERFGKGYKHTGDFGVYVDNGLVDPETGVPETILVRLRDDSHALVSVPYEACRPAQAGGR